MPQKEYTFKEVQEITGLPDYTVRYRVDRLGVGRRIHETLFLYSQDDVEKIRNYQEAQRSQATAGDSK